MNAKVSIHKHMNRVSWQRLGWILAMVGAGSAVSVVGVMQPNAPLQYVALGFMGMMIVVTFCQVQMVWHWVFTPDTHPFIRDLMRYGQPEQVAYRIEAQLNDGYHPMCGDIHVTMDWLVKVDRHRLIVLKLSDVIWAHKGHTISS